MKLKDLEAFLKDDSGQHTSNIYIPSIKRDIAFRPISTADVKTLSRIGMISDFDLNNELMKLSLFDKLCIETKESCGIDSSTILPIDFLSFLIGLRKLLSNELTFTFTCKNCQKKFEKTLDLEEIFEKQIFGFQQKELTYEKVDDAGNLWTFVLANYTMKEYLYFRYYLDRVSDIDAGNPEVISPEIYSRPALYIKSISKNGEVIDDWKDHIISEKIKLISMLPSEIVVDTRNSKDNSPDSCLAAFIKANFDDEKIFEYVSQLSVECPHCEEEYKGVFDFDDFFMF